MRHKGKAPMTPTEARKLGYEFEDPETPVCEHCGRALEALGVPGRDNTVIWISRTVCDCDGAKRQVEEERRRAERAAERELAEAYARSGVKPRFINAEIDSPALAAYLNGFNERPDVGLYITGPSRAGKSHSASALAKAFVASGYSTTMTTSLAMLDDIKASFDGGGRPGIERFISRDVLIIDDLGKENANSWVMTTLFQIINARYEAMRPIIVTSQYAPDELCRRMSRSGERESAVAITERLKETSRLITLPSRRNVRLMEEIPTQP